MSQFSPLISALITLSQQTFAILTFQLCELFPPALRLIVKVVDAESNERGTCTTDHIQDVPETSGVDQAHENKEF